MYNKKLNAKAGISIVKSSADKAVCRDGRICSEHEILMTDVLKTYHVQYRIAVVQDDMPTKMSITDI